MLQQSLSVLERGTIFSFIHDIWKSKRNESKMLCPSCRDNLRNILLSVYGNKESVDEELVEVLLFSSSCISGSLKISICSDFML